MNSLPAEPVRRPPGRPLAIAFAGVLLAKLLVLAADPQLRVFMGDSGSYLHTALTGWIPHDRSFVYGFFVRVAGLWPGSGTALVLAQTGLGVASAGLLAWLLLRAFSLPAWLAWLAALLLALDPGQLLYERMLMAEAAGLLALLAHVALLVAYARSGRGGWMLLAAPVGILAVSLRISALPLVLGLACTVPWIAARRADADRAGWPPWRWRALHLALALGATAFFHLGYAYAYGRLALAPVGYLPSAGMMRIGLVAPLVRPEHFQGTGVPGRVLDEVGVPLSDPRQREAQVWSPRGLYPVIARHSPRPERVARVVTARALAERPWALLPLGLDTVRAYFEPALREHRLQDDLGRRPPDPGMVAAMQASLGVDVAAGAGRDSLATRWYERTWPWTLACYLLLPPLALLALALSWRGPSRPAALVLCLASLGLAAGQFLFAHVPSFRYLQPFPWFLLANAAVCAGALWPVASGKAGPGVAR